MAMCTICRSDKHQACSCPKRPGQRRAFVVGFMLPFVLCAAMFLTTCASA